MILPGFLSKDLRPQNKPEFKATGMTGTPYSPLGGLGEVDGLNGVLHWMPLPPTVVYFGAYPLSFSRNLQRIIKLKHDIDLQKCLK